MYKGYFTCICVLAFWCVSHSLVAPYDVTIMGDNTYNNNNGDRLELSCSSEGGPGLTYSWSRTMNDFETSTTTNTSTLNISSVATVDGGDYTCTVTNGAGSNISTITVYGEFALTFIMCYRCYSVGH